MIKFALIVPTLNPGRLWEKWVKSLQEQNIKPAKVLVIDSGSTDNTLDICNSNGFEVNSISKSEFNHGGTRLLALKSVKNVDVVIYMTQDAILANEDSISNILQPFNDVSIAAVCGRQLPRMAAGLIEAHARIFNYPSISFTRTIDDKARYGLKTAFISNSFAAYRREALLSVGGFPKDVIFGEDMYASAKLLLAGYKIAYAGDACVYHSHNYTLLQEFKRYFDMGVFHAHESWIKKELGSPEREGVKFVHSELKYLFRHAFWLIPEAVLRTVLKYIGFRLGLIEKRLPLWMKRSLAMNKSYFK